MSQGLPEEEIEEEEESQEVEIPERQYVKNRINEVTTLDESKLPQEVFGSEIIEDEDSPYTVVPSYIRRKKPKNMKDWWEEDIYQSTPRNNGEINVTERTYMGHRVLPPDLGGEL